MIVILCNSFEEAQNDFQFFLNYLNYCDPYSVSRVFRHSYCVETDGNLRYIFVDYRFKNLAWEFDDEIDYIGSDEFFDDINVYGLNDILYGVR